MITTCKKKKKRKAKKSKEIGVSNMPNQFYFKLLKVTKLWQNYQVPKQSQIEQNNVIPPVPSAGPLLPFL